MRGILILTLCVACGEKTADPVEVCNQAKAAASVGWGDAHKAALVHKGGPEAEADAAALSAAQVDAKKAKNGATAARYAPGHSVARGVTRANSNAKSATVRSAAAKVARYDELVAATQAAKDASLGRPQAAWDATLSARKAVQSFWAAPESPPDAYAVALAAGEAAWTVCSVVPES